VMVQKRTLIALLDELASQVQAPANSFPQGPVEIDTGMVQYKHRR
jgi:hypothetical protein